MTGMRVLVSDGLEQSGLSILAAETQVDDRQGILAEELGEIIGQYEGLIVRGRTKVTADLIEKAGRLKVIGRAGVGVDNIDLQASKTRGIAVVNAPLSTSRAVAELAIGLLFCLTREIPRADQGLKDGKWLKKELMGIEISGKKLGIIGMGNIGSIVAENAAGLGMSVFGYDPYLDDEVLASRSVKPLKLEELLSTCDFITIHIPLNEKTRGMIDSHAFEQMKTGVRLICTARGGIISEDALLEALNSGKVAGAALDVFVQEPPGLIPLVQHPKVIATPHIGAQTNEAQNRAAQDIANEVLNALNGKPLRWQVA
jgi:D-3-phosphoglycerate dehydrogenase